MENTKRKRIVSRGLFWLFDTRESGVENERKERGIFDN